MDKVKNNIVKILFLLPAVVIYGYFVVASTMLSFPYSIFELKGFTLSKFIGLKNYFRIPGDEFFRGAFINTLIYVVASVALITFISILVAVLINFINIKHLRGYKFFRSIYLLPATLSSVVVGLLWTFIYHPNIGMLNGFLELIGLGQFSQPWLTNQSLVLLMIVIVAAWQWSGFYILLIFTAIISNVSKELYEAAFIDGISDFKLVTKIILPLITGTIENCVVLAMIGSFKAFDLIWIMTKGGPVNASEVFVTYLFRRGFEWGDFSYATSLGVVLLLVCLIVTMSVRAFFKKRNYLN